MLTPLLQEGEACACCPTWLSEHDLYQNIPGLYNFSRYDHVFIFLMLIVLFSIFCLQTNTKFNKEIPVVLPMDPVTNGFAATTVLKRGEEMQNCRCSAFALHFVDIVNSKLISSLLRGARDGDPGILVYCALTACNLFERKLISCQEMLIGLHTIWSICFTQRIWREFVNVFIMTDR